MDTPIGSIHQDILKETMGETREMQTYIDQIVQASLGFSLPKAIELTRFEFCSDCPRKHDRCFPCRTARTMIRVYLAALVQKKAALN